MIKHTDDWSWTRVVGQPDYAVSNEGRVKHIPTGEILEQKVHNLTGHSQVYFNDGTMRYVANLVAEAFRPGYNFTHQISHKNGDKACNWDSNLVVVDSGWLKDYGSTIV